MDSDDGGRNSNPGAGPGSERAAIVRAALDYIEGWFDGDVARMERVLHPELARQTLQDDGSVRTLTREMMLAFTAEGGGRSEDAPNRQLEVEVDRLDAPLATAVVRSHLYVDHLHLVRTQAGWKIVSMLWQRRRPP
ncbi:MAG TPA: nuclear transport factor 2 family protein [Candidatus Acidoferrum sp.]|nr:nuclear transport factor 2 family protein [Candidatus Acidoferrum sp.]